MPTNPGDNQFPGALPTATTLFDTVNSPTATTLNGGISDSDTAIVLTSAAAYPTTGAIKIDSEIIFYSGKAANTLTAVTRGADNTSAAAHSNGAAVRMVNISRMREVQNDEIIALATKVGTGSSTPVNLAFMLGSGTGTSAWSTQYTRAKSTNFWLDIHADVIIQRFNDRVFLGAATDNDGKLTNIVADWLDTLIHPTTSNAQFACLNTIAQIGILGASRTSDIAQVTAGTIGVMGFASNDNTSHASSSYAGYFESWFTATSVGAAALSIEAEIVNKDSDAPAITPFAMFPTGMCAAFWAGSGGDRASVNDASAAMGIITNGARFASGIVFQATSLIGTDGTGSGSAPALQMAIGHQVTWQDSSVVRSILDYNVIKLNVTSGTTVTGTKLHIQSDDAAGQNIQMDSYSTNSGNNLVFRAARGTAASPTQLLANDVIASAGARGYHSGPAFSTVNNAKLSMFAAEDFTATAQGTYITLETTPKASVTRAERWRVEHGGWLIGKELTANPTTTELAAGDQVAIYRKADKLVFAHNVGGTINYLTIDLDGSDTTWTQGTSAP